MTNGAMHNDVINQCSYRFAVLSGWSQARFADAPGPDVHSTTTSTNPLLPQPCPAQNGPYSARHVPDRPRPSA